MLPPASFCYLLLILPELWIAQRPLGDALEFGAVVEVLDDLGISPCLQVFPEDRARLRAVLVKCEPERRLHIRGHRHTMLDHANIKAQRHVRGAVGCLAGVIGDPRIFALGGAEHQSADGGGLIAAIADSTPAA